jgi:hypothetical protein
MMRWAGHVVRTGNMIYSYRIFVVNFELMVLPETSMYSWEGNINQAIHHEGI